MSVRPHQTLYETTSLKQVINMAYYEGGISYVYTLFVYGLLRDVSSSVILNSRYTFYLSLKNMDSRVEETISVQNRLIFSHET